MRRARWFQAVTVGALAAGAVGLACETWALACRAIDLDDTSNAADVVWIDRDDASPPPSHPTLDASTTSLDVAMPAPSPVAAFRLPVPHVSARRHTTACFHAPRAPPALLPA